MENRRFFTQLKKSAHWFWGWKYRNHAFVTVFFIVWSCILSPNTIGSQIKAYKELQELRRTKDFYLHDIQHNEQLINRFLSDPDFVETYGRENYLMKRENEDIFLFE